MDNNLTQKVSASDPVQITMLKGLVAGATNTVIALALGAWWPSGFVLASAAVVGFFGYGVSLMLYVRALRGLGTARTGAYFSLAPFIGAGLGILLWREPVTLTFVAAATLMGFGLWLHLTSATPMGTPTRRWSTPTRTSTTCTTSTYTGPTTRMVSRTRTRTDMSR